MFAVNFELLHQALLQANGNVNQVVYWQLPDGKSNAHAETGDDLSLSLLQHQGCGSMVIEIP